MGRPCPRRLSAKREPRHGASSSTLWTKRSVSNAEALLGGTSSARGVRSPSGRRTRGQKGDKEAAKSRLRRLWWETQEDSAPTIEKHKRVAKANILSR